MNKHNYWVVTDLDGTLMDHNYDVTPAIDTINWIKDQGIPIIPCTSKTAAEVRKFRTELLISDPYIVENGGAIYGECKNTSKTWHIKLGRTYEELRPLLDSLGNKINSKLISFNDLSKEEIQRLTGLIGEDIELALKREWSVPFLNPSSEEMYKLKQLAFNYDLSILQGNRMSHLLDKASHKGRAVQELKRFLNNSDVTIIALGDSPNDLPLLEVADIPIVVPGPRGPNKCFIEGINIGRFNLAPAPHAYGWSIAVDNTLKKLLVK